MREIKAAEKLKKGYSRALPEIMDIYTPYAYTIIKNISDGRLGQQDIEECLSDTFLSLWENSEKIQPEKLKAYIGTIARSKALDKLRGLKIILPLEEDIILARCEEPEAQSIKNELAELIKQAVEDLPEPDREIFKRRYFLMESCDTIAEKTAMNPSTVRTRLSRGLLKLRKYLGERGYDNENSFD